MKTFANIKYTITGNKITLTADIVDKDFSRYPAQHQTIVHTASGNRRHRRHFHLSEAGAIIRTPGKNLGFVFQKQDMVDLATAIEPRLSYAPVAAPIGKDLTANISSELTPDLQWQASADGGRTWTDIAGQTTKTLDRATVKAGQQVRLKASSEAGTMISNSTLV